MHQVTRKLRNGTRELGSGVTREGTDRTGTDPPLTVTPCRSSTHQDSRDRVCERQPRKRRLPPEVGQ
eukprot:2150529-Prymnesium_polylepis.1